MDIIISGLGAVGTTLMQELADEGHNVVVVDINGDKIEKAVNQFDVKGVIGNSASADVLKEANVAYAELFIGATNHDELNILCCIIAKRLGAKKTIARVSKPEYLELFGNETNFGISLLVNPQYEAALEISRMLRFPSAIKVNEFSNGKVELVEFRVDETSDLVGLELKNLSSNSRQKSLFVRQNATEKQLSPAAISSFARRIDFSSPQRQKTYRCFSSNLAGTSNPKTSSSLEARRLRIIFAKSLTNSASTPNSSRKTNKKLGCFRKISEKRTSFWATAQIRNF